MSRVGYIVFGSVDLAFGIAFALGAIWLAMSADPFTAITPLAAAALMGWCARESFRAAALDPTRDRDWPPSCRASRSDPTERPRHTRGGSFRRPTESARGTRGRSYCNGQDR